MRHVTWSRCNSIFDALEAVVSVEGVAGVAKAVIKRLTN